MEEAEYCDRLALMNRGRLIALDTPGRLRSSLDERILEVRVDHSPEAIEVLRGSKGIGETAMFGRELHVTVDDVEDGTRRIREGLGEAGIEVRGIRRIEPGLEDVFVSRVRTAGGAPAG